MPLLGSSQHDLIKNSFGTNTDSLIEAIASFYGWKSASDGLSEYVYGQIKTFEQEQSTNHEIADWLRRLAQIELSPNDIKFKKSPNMKKNRE